MAQNFGFDSGLSSSINVLGSTAGLFSQIADSTPITNTTTAASVIGTGVGSLSVPANSFLVGNAYTVKVGGIISTLVNHKITFFLKSGATTLANTGLITLSAATNSIWQLEVTFVIHALGVAGVADLKSHFLFSYEENASDKFEGHAFDINNNATFDTTILNTLDIDAKWNQTSASDSIYSTVLNLNKIY